MRSKKLLLLFGCKHNHAKVLIRITEGGENLSVHSEIGVPHVGALRCLSHTQRNRTKLIRIHNWIQLSIAYRRKILSCGEPERTSLRPKGLIQQTANSCQLLYSEGSNFSWKTLQCADGAFRLLGGSRIVAQVVTQPRAVCTGTTFFHRHRTNVHTMIAEINAASDVTIPRERDRIHPLSPRLNRFA
jgi:hypothetical protein